MTEEFFGLVKVAREFLARGIYQNACIEYVQAWNGYQKPSAQRLTISR